MKLKTLRNTELGDINCYDADSTRYILKEIIDLKTYDNDLFHYSDNPTIIDVGGNIGIFSLYFAKKLPTAKIISIEPIADNYRALSANIASSQYRDRITPINYGLSDFESPEEVVFHYYPNTSVLSTMNKVIIEDGFFKHQNVDTAKIFFRKIRSRINPIKYHFNMLLLSIPWVSAKLYKAMVSNFSKTISVRCQMTNLSSVIEKHGLSHIDLLKIDAEGAEVNILNGIAQEHWPMIRQVVMEVHHRDFVPVIRGLLEKHGFHKILLEDDDFAGEDIEKFQKLYAIR